MPFQKVRPTQAPKRVNLIKSHPVSLVAPARADRVEAHIPVCFQPPHHLYGSWKLCRLPSFAAPTDTSNSKEAQQNTRAISRRSFDEHERPVAGISQIAEPTGE